MVSIEHRSRFPTAETRALSTPDTPHPSYGGPGELMREKLQAPTSIFSFGCHATRVATLEEVLSRRHAGFVFDRIYRSDRIALGCRFLILNLHFFKLTR